MGKALSTLLGVAFTSTILFGLAGCGRKEASSPSQPTSPAATLDPLAIVLAPHEGDTPLDAEIRRRQTELRSGIAGVPALERLGWLFVAKARDTFDPGFYKLAEQCALALETRTKCADALLLRGHALHSQHRFKEAETIARELVKQRGLSFDHGLLGDVLVDLGSVDDAARVYQTMLDLKPDPHGYARAAHIRWLKGDVAGAIDLMRMAARGASPRDVESAAWIQTQLARYLWQARLNEEAKRALDEAFELRRDYPPALLLRGRMLLAAGEHELAISLLRVAAQANSLPEYLWVLSEALRAGGHETEAHEIEGRLVASGWADPRTCSLFLATRAKRAGLALTLAREELGERSDVFTHDAMAWALAIGGCYGEAREHISQALMHGTQDARLFLHAGIIAAKSGEAREAHGFFTQLAPLTHLLLPSERRQLDAALWALNHMRSSNAAPDQLSSL